MQNSTETQWTFSGAAGDMRNNLEPNMPWAKEGAKHHAQAAYS